MSGNINGLGASIIVAALLHGCMTRTVDHLSGESWSGREGKCSALYKTPQARFACTDGDHAGAAAIEMEASQ